MDYATAVENRHSVERTIRFLRQHAEVNAEIIGHKLAPIIRAEGVPSIDPDGREVPNVAYFIIGKDGCVSGREVLDWLGY
jgi:hypothetical protein